MKVSIIIPAYNEEQYITKTIDAVLAQDYPDFEIIIVNNNSTDNTVGVISPYLTNEKISVIHESRQGLLFARNAGLTAAKGEVLAQLDADCIPNKEWLTTAMPHFKNKNIAGITGAYDYYDASLFFRYMALFNQKVFFRFMSWYVQKKKMGAMLIGGNAFIRISAINQAGGYNTALSFYAEDTDTACRIAAFGYVRYLPQLVVKTSARRFKQQGYFSIQKKYAEAFFALMHGREFGKEKSNETTHPR